MSSPAWERIERLFHQALEHPPEARAAFLKDACGGQPELADDVAALLAAHERSGDLPSLPSAWLGAVGAPEPARFTPGERIADASMIPASLFSPHRVIGPYHVLQEIGTGGMGEVFLAEQEKPVRRKVALKLIKPGMDTKEVVARFESERQALALLNHPNIAQVFEAGATEEGRPYFAMEYVPGVPITEYATEQRLQLAQRLELFLRVCDAVQHAHQKGLIHRDLKPSNVLVTLQDGKPIPKIIDFGVAKATAQRLTDMGMHTMVGQVVGTPGYMSPEQAGAGALDVDTRTDVYALGVLLYELLVGVLPFDLMTLRTQGNQEFLRRIREEEPKKPSIRVASLEESGIRLAASLGTDLATLRRQLRGDLDWIALKALEKDRTRRYASASELAEDVRRHLRHEPVLASPPSTAYKVRKFVRRHRGGVAAAAIATAALILGIVGTGVGLFRAVRAEHQARSEAETARLTTSFLVDLFQVSDPGVARGNTVTAREILDRGAEKIDRELKERPEVKARLMDTMGEVYMGLGLSDRATALFDSALRLRRDRLGENNAEVASSVLRLGRAYLSLGRYRDAEPLLAEALAVRRKVLPPGDADIGYAVYWLSIAVFEMGRPVEAGALLSEAQGIFQEALGPEDIAVAWCVNDQAVIQNHLGNYAEALPGFEEAARIKEKKLGSDHPDAIAGWQNVASTLTRMGKVDQARPILQRVIAQATRVLGPDHPYMGMCLTTLGQLEDRSHDPTGARHTLARALEIQLRSPSPNNRTLAETYQCLAHVEAELGSYQLAVREYKRALNLDEIGSGANGLRTAACLEEYASVLEKIGQAPEASAARARAEAIRAKAATPE
jgi:serine/threonine protein kinase/tetratricopeptide (TPR) repeat protein